MEFSSRISKQGESKRIRSSYEYFSIKLRKVVGNDEK
jgi:hypothetical protein